VIESLASDPPAARRGAAAALHDVAQAWRGIGRLEWVVALAAGFGIGLGQTLIELATVAGDEPGTAALALLVFAAMKMVPMYVAAAALLLPGLAALDRRDDRGMWALASHAALGVVVALVAGALGQLTHPLAAAAVRTLGMAHPFAELSFTWSSALSFSLLRSMNVLIVVSLATLVFVYLRRARRTALRLAAAQLRRSDAERRVLAEQLNGTQALVEPTLLFDTLRRVGQLYERDAASAERLLDSLIAYLRAVMPVDDSGSTVGQQAELVRARLEIERIRLGGRLAFRIDVPDALAQRPLAPLLLAPLAANAVRHGVEPSGGGEVTLRARQLEDRLVVEVGDGGSGRAASIHEGAGLSGVRERLARLYGERARLVLADRTPRGLTARLEIETEGRT